MNVALFIEYAVQNNYRWMFTDQMSGNNLQFCKLRKVLFGVFYQVLVFLVDFFFVNVSKYKRIEKDAIQLKIVKSDSKSSENYKVVPES